MQYTRHGKKYWNINWKQEETLNVPGFLRSYWPQLAFEAFEAEI